MATKQALPNVLGGVSMSSLVRLEVGKIKAFPRVKAGALVTLEREIDIRSGSREVLVSLDKRAFDMIGEGISVRGMVGMVIVWAWQTLLDDDAALVVAPDGKTTLMPSVPGAPRIFGKFEYGDIHKMLIPLPEAMIDQLKEQSSLSLSKSYSALFLCGINELIRRNVSLYV